MAWPSNLTPKPPFKVSCSQTKGSYFAAGPNVPSWAYNISREGYKVTMDQSCGYSENTLSGARHKLTGTNATCVESTTDTVSVKFYKWNFDACCDGNEWPAQCTLGTFQENRDPIPAGICFPLSS